MLAVSGEKTQINIVDDEEEEWPDDPETSQPFAP